MCRPGAFLAGGGFISCVSGGGGFFTAGDTVLAQTAFAFSAAFSAAIISARCAGSPLNLADLAGDGFVGVKVQTPSGSCLTGGPDPGRRLGSYCPHALSVLLPGWLPGGPVYAASGMLLDRGGGLAGGPAYAAGGALAG